jgi:hypothetical protein
MCAGYERSNLDAVGKVAQRYIAEHALQDRIITVELDMFKDPWPTGHDGVFFSNIFHDWDRNRCLFLSRRTFEALPSGGRIFVNEMLLDETKDRPLAATSFSMTHCYYSLVAARKPQAYCPNLFAIDHWRLSGLRADNGQTRSNPTCLVSRVIGNLKIDLSGLHVNQDQPQRIGDAVRVWMQTRSPCWDQNWRRWCSPRRTSSVIVDCQNSSVFSVRLDDDNRHAVTRPLDYGEHT